MPELTYVAYRLYTVIPKLLDLIADLTNWYIRFNRTRLKGSGGEADTLSALNTLYEALFTLCLTMVSYVFDDELELRADSLVLIHPLHF